MESDSPLKTRRGKNTASMNLEEVTPRKGRMAPLDSSDSESEHSSKRVQREKPLAETSVSETYSFNYHFNLPLSYPIFLCFSALCVRSRFLPLRKGTL